MIISIPFRTVQRRKRTLTLNIPPTEPVPQDTLDIRTLGTGLAPLKRPIHTHHAEDVAGQTVWISADRHHSSARIIDDGFELRADIEADDF